MKLQVKPKDAAQELTVQSQKEFLQLYNRGVIAADDLVLRGERWVRARDLPWIHGMHQETKRDNKQLFWITLAMMVLGLVGVFWIQAHSATVARKTGAVPPPADQFPRPTQQQGERPLPPGAVRAVPSR